MPNTKATDQASLVGSFVPPGVIMPFGGATAPSGWLLCDGSAVSQTTYAALYSSIAAAWGNPGGGSFNLPDLAGRFLRGKTNNVARDPDYATRTAANTGGNTADNVGSVQGDVFQGHSHQVDARTTPTAIQGAASLMGNSLTSDMGFGGAAHALGTLGTNGTPRSSKETRPINANVNYIIKY